MRKIIGIFCLTTLCFVPVIRADPPPFDTIIRQSSGNGSGRKPGGKPTKQTFKRYQLYCESELNSSESQTYSMSQLPKMALLLTSLLRGRDQRGLLSVEVDQLASNTVACSPYDGPMGSRSFRKFEDLQRWSENNPVYLDTMGRPYAMGIHLDHPINVGMSNSKFLACVLVAEDASSIDPNIKIVKRREGTYAFSQYVNQSPANTWAHVLKMEEWLAKEKSFHNEVTGWWEQYALCDWEDLVNGRVSRATVGFRID